MSREGNLTTAVGFGNSEGFVRTAKSGLHGGGGHMVDKGKPLAPGLKGKAGVEAPKHWPCWTCYEWKTLSWGSCFVPRSGPNCQTRDSCFSHGPLGLHVHECKHQDSSNEHIVKPISLLHQFLTLPSKTVLKTFHLGFFLFI